MLRQLLRNEMQSFPLASTQIARRQAARLIRARAYLKERGILATDPNSHFTYKRVSA